MASETGENNGEMATPLVVGHKLPPSAVDKKFVDVKRDHVVYWDALPQELQDLNAPKWKRASFLKKSFTTPPTGHQTTRQKSPLKFPFCLLTFGPAATCVRERLIVVNWWLNLSKDEQEAVWESVRRLFFHPTVSADLLNPVNPNDPKAVGSADKMPLRKKRLQESQSYDRVHGEKKKRKHRGDYPKTNPQLRDYAVHEPEANIQKNILTSMERTRIVPENEANVSARWEPMYSTTSTAFSPSRGKSDNAVRAYPINRHYVRNRTAAALCLESIARAMKENSANFSLESISGEDIMVCLEQSNEHSFHYEQDKENWDGIQYAAKKKAGNVRGMPSVVQQHANTGEGETTQATNSNTVVGQNVDDYDWDF